MRIAVECKSVKCKVEHLKFVHKHGTYSKCNLFSYLSFYSYQDHVYYVRVYMPTSAVHTVKI